MKPHTEQVEKKVDDIMLDFCTKLECKEATDHVILKQVVRDRTIELAQEMYSLGVKEGREAVYDPLLLLKASYMKELIEKWREFEEDWWKTAPFHGYSNGKSTQFKPTFYDFMQWLAANSSL